MPEWFSLFSEHWVGPLFSALTILGGICLLYPLLWQLGIKQLSAAVQAIETAKTLPDTISKLTDASTRLQTVNSELVSLRDQLSALDGISERIQVVSRQLADIERRSDEVIPAAVPPAAGAERRRPNSQLVDQASEIWHEVRDGIEKLITSIPDGRVRRKYNSVTRYQYGEVASYLVNDAKLTERQAAALNEIDAAYRSIRNRRTEVTQGDIEKFKAWRNEILPPTGLAS